VFEVVTAFGIRKAAKSLSTPAPPPAPAEPSAS
jgi:hypothetical protein